MFGRIKASVKIPYEKIEEELNAKRVGFMYDVNYFELRGQLDVTKMLSLVKEYSTPIEGWTGNRF